MVMHYTYLLTHKTLPVSLFQGLVGVGGGVIISAPSPFAPFDTFTDIMTAAVAPGRLDSLKQNVCP